MDVDDPTNKLVNNNIKAEIAHVVRGKYFT